MTKIQIMICGLCEIIDGLVSIFTLGNYRTNLAFHYTCHATIGNIRRK